MNDHRLIEHCKPAYVITLAPDATGAEFKAAHELKDHLRLITDMKFALVAPTRARAGTVIAVGSGAARAVGLPARDLKGLGDDGICIRSVGSHIVLTGDIDSKRGTLYAVYEFLHEWLGCRWWTSDSATIPHNADPVIPRLDYRYIPPFEYREIMFQENWNVNWAVRNRTNGIWENKKLPGVPASWGGHKKFALWVHTLVGPLVEPERFQKSPDWFALFEGERNAGQLCLSHPAVFAHVLQKTRTILKANPDAEAISISQNDNHIHCRCPKCAAIDAREGSPAGSLLTFINALAARLEKEFPRVAFETLAYLYSRKPPRHIRPHQNVIIRLCSFECDFAHPLTHANNRPFYRDLQGWSKMCHRLYMWDYVTNYAHFIQPHPNWFVLADNVRLFRANNVKGVFEQGNQCSMGGENAHLRSWMLARLLWNPDQDINVLMDEFLQGHYGAADKPIRRYLDMVYKATQAIGYYPGSKEIQKCLKRRGYPQARKGCYLDLNAQPDAPFLSIKIILEGLALFAEAEKRVQRMTRLTQRVRQAAMPLHYIALLRWNELRAAARKTGKAWLLADNRIEECRRFTVQAKALKVTHLGEGWSQRTLPWLSDLCRTKKDFVV